MSSKSPVKSFESDQETAVWSVLDAVPAWGVSLFAHVCVILAVAMITLPDIILPEINLTSTIEPEEVRQEFYELSTTPTETLGSLSSLNIQGESAAAAQDRGLDNHVEQVEQIQDSIVNPRIAQVESLPTPNEAEALENIDLTGTTEQVGGTEGAVDRITLEIAASLRQRKTIPIWLFDESLSLESRRELITNRFEGIYRQLGLIDDIDTQGALKTGVIGYGENVHVLIKEPTSDLSELTSAVRGIKNDESGKENVFAAIAEALKVYTPVKRKMHANMMFIIVTDERGDDYQGLEEVVKRCAREGIKVYCIGNASIFGREKGFVRYKWTYEGEEFEEDIPVDQGPETAMAEGLQLPFWTNTPRDLTRMSSGYGPYTLSRVTAETGGIFLIADDAVGDKWDPQIMRQYTPDYRPQSQYMKELQGNLAKQALVGASQIALTEDVPIPQQVFQANNDNILREQITEAQKPLAVLDYFLQRVHTLLDAGEKHRDKLDSDRWRASFDLAMGRILAMRVRAFGYNAVLAEMKSNPKRFERADSNQWRLEPSENINAGANVRKMNDKALEYLNRVITEHPGTPWAYLAKVELRDPLGWDWVEGQTSIAQMGNGGDPKRNPQFAAEEEQKRQADRQRQQKKSASRPKL
ncbi:MAG TPA: vWA domain-containing protein [Planctomycetaceae bacterium]|nr:vWA domain-containing protein [Planctomycetaceae bacterium]